MSESTSKDRFTQELEQLRCKYAELKSSYEEVLAAHRQSEDARLAYEGRYKAIFESTGTASLLIEADTTIVMANHECLKLTGYDADELVGQKWAQFVCPESLQEMTRIHHLRRESPELAPQKYAVKLLNRQNEKRDVVLSVNMIPETRQSLVSMIDITENNIAHEKINRANVQWNTTFDALEDALFVLDNHMKIQHANKAAIQLFGKNEEEMLGKSCFDIVLLEDCAIAEYPLTRIGKSKKRETMLWPAGDKWFEIVVDPLLNEKNELLGAVHIVSDVTLRIQNKIQLEKSYLSLQMLIDLAADAFFQGDSKGNFIMVNKAAIQLTGYSVAEMKKMNIADIFSKTLLEGKPLRYDLLDIGQSLTVEREIIRKDGIHVPVEMHSTKMMDGTYQSFFRDITDRKKAEADLIKAKNIAEENETRYRALHNASFGGIAIHDRGFILDCNQGLSEITGYTTEELIGMDGLLLISENTRELVRTNIVNGFEKPYEAVGSRKNGQEYPLRLEAREIPYKGKSARVVEFRDITEQKLAETQIEKHKAELEAYFENDISADYVATVSGKVESCNKTFLSLFGFEKKSDAELYDISRLYKNQEDRKNIIRLLKDQRKIENLEVSFVSKNGKPIEALINAIGIFNNDNQLEKIRGYVVDISQQKKLEKELLRSEEKYRRFFEDDLSGNYHTTRDGKILTCNDAFVKMLKYQNKEEIYQINTSELYFGPSARNEFIHQLTTEKKLKNNALTLKASDGSEVEIIENVIGIFDDSGELIEMIGYMSDITAQKKAQLALQQSEAKYIDLYENSPEIFLSVEPENATIVQCNNTMAEKTGYQKHELIGKSLTALYHPASHDTFKKNLVTFRETGKVFDSELEVVKKDGSVMTILLNTSAVYDQNGKILHSRSVWRDITERKFYENELQKLSRVVEQSPTSIIIANYDGDIEYVNPKATEITGYSKEELIGKNPRVFNSGEKSKSEYEQLWSIIKAGNRWAGEFRNKKKNGELFWESATISPVLNEKNDIVNFIAVKEDITERKRFDETRKLILEISKLTSKHVSLYTFLAQVHRKIQGLIRAENFYVALHNEKDNTYSFPYHVDAYDELELNKAYDFTGGFTDYVLHSNQSLIIQPDEQHEIEQNGTVKGYGSERSVWLGVPFKTGKGDQPNGVIAIQDYKNLESYSETDKTVMEIIALSIGGFIERIKFVEELIMSKEKAEESDRLKSAFLANMSHEIRTPMNGILGFTELLLKPDLSSEEKETYIDIVNRSGKRMLNTVNDIVEIAKIEAGIISVDRKEVDVQERLDELIRFFAPEASRKGLKLILENKVNPSVGLLFTDPNKIDSIFTNLIKNAIKYTPSGEIRLGSTLSEETLEFYVKDTGIGIPTERHQAVFERFVQADIADKDARQGSGLGLAITKAYVAMLGGKIWVESKEGNGSTFYFSLPVASHAAEKTTISTELPDDTNTGKEKPVSRALKILIAEDDETSFELISIVLSKISKEIIWTKNGVNAVEICRQNPDIDLVLMDIQLPGLNGHEATRQIRAFNQQVVIIAQTAFALSGDREKALEAGCNDYVAKPIKQKILFESIQHWLHV